MKRCTPSDVELFFHRSGKHGPGIRFQIAQNGPHPFVLRMLFQKVSDDEIVSAGMTHRRPELHLLSHRSVDRFRLHRAAGIELAPIPFWNPARRTFDATAQAALVWSARPFE